MNTDLAIIIPKEGNTHLSWSPVHGMAYVVKETKSVSVPDNRGVIVQVNVYMALNAINTLTSFARQMPELEPDKSYCVQEMAKCRERLLAAAIKVPHELMASKSGEDQLRILADIKEFGRMCVMDAVAALEHLGAKCKQTSEILQLMFAMRQEAEMWRAKALEGNPLADYPERDEYTPKFFADRTGIEVATVRHHLRELQKRHGRKKHSKDEGRWRIFDIEDAKKFEVYLRENGRGKTSIKAPKTLT